MVTGIFMGAGDRVLIIHSVLDWASQWETGEAEHQDQKPLTKTLWLGLWSGERPHEGLEVRSHPMEQETKSNNGGHLGLSVKPSLCSKITFKC